MTLITALLLFAMFGISNSQEYYIIPSSTLDSDCPFSDEPCHSFSYYARHSSTLLSNRENVSLIFLNGVYNLHGESLEVTNFGILSLKGYISSNCSSQVEIKDLSAIITNSSSLVIDSLTMYHSHVDIANVADVESHRLVLNQSHFVILAVSVNSVSFSMSKLVEANWFLFWGYNEGTISVEEIDMEAAGVVPASNVSMPTITVSNVTSEKNSSILIRLALSNHSIRADIDNCVFLSSNGLQISMYQEREQPLARTTLNIRDCMWYNNFNCLYLLTNYTSTSLHVNNCFFFQNNFNLLILNTKGSVNASVSNSHYVGGVNKHSRASIIFFSSFQPQSDSSLILHNVFVVNNSISHGVVVLAGPANVTVSGCFFSGNSAFLAGAMYLINVNLLFEGDTTFLSNSGTSGGAIHVSQDSVITLGNNSVVSFMNNKGYFGGAIFVDDLSSRRVLDDILEIPSQDCFYQLPGIYEQKQYPQVYFNNNSANFSGDHIYGAALKDRCIVNPGGNVSSYLVYDEIFHFNTPSLSPVSSSPTRVCACKDNVPQCADMNYIYINKFVIPGEKLNIKVMVVGYDFGAVSGGVYASGFYKNGMPVDGPLDQFKINVGQEIQQVALASTCTNLEYTVHINFNGSGFFSLSTSTFLATVQHFSRFIFSPLEVGSSVEMYNDHDLIRANLLFSPIVLNLTILPCPIGFVFDSTDWVCVCDDEIQEYAFKCAVRKESGVFYRKGTNWIGMLNGDEFNKTLFLYDLCPFSYCVPDETSVTLSDHDSQCALNHSGVLCGGCPPGLSLAIGSSRCLDCPDNIGVTIAFFIVFIVQGLALVFVIKLLDLTISQGTLNGIILYVNIVWINQEIFFPQVSKLSDPYLNYFYKAMRLFIAWLNDDFGIESCFIYGLSAQGKVWLQFLFPIYLFGIALSIILACRYSTKLTKIFGNNSVSLLSTLFLLNYLKLIRIVFSVFSFAHLNEYGSENVVAVWLLDGNVYYSELSHLLLVCICVLVAILLSIITISLLFISYLHKLPFRLTNLSPFIDSMVSILKEKHRYWIGLTLCVRVLAMLIAFTLHSVSKQSILAVLIILTAGMGALCLKVFKKTYLTLLEFVNISNILIVSVCFLAIPTKDFESRVLCISISVLVTYIIHIAVIFAHTYPKIKKLHLAVKSVCSRKFKKSSESNDSADIENPVPCKTPTSSIVEIQTENYSLFSEQEAHSSPRQLKINVANFREELLDSEPT